MMEAIIYKHGPNDFEIWFPDLPDEAKEEIEKILYKYNDTGYSARGTAEEIAEELKEI